MLLNAESVSELKKRLSYGDLPKDWITVGYLAMILINMMHHDFPGKARGGISKGRAVHLLAHLEMPGAHVNTSDINTAWTKYKSVCHFCFAYTLLTESEENLTRFDPRYPQSLVNFLSVAQHAQEHLVQIKPKHSRQPRLISRADLWYLPKWLKFRKSSVNYPPFGVREIKILEQYI